MQTFAFPAEIEPGDNEGVMVVSFPDVPEAITEGRGRAEALAAARDALGLALLTYPRRALPLPTPTRPAAGLVEVAVEPTVAAKLALLEAFRTAMISKSELARRLGKDEKEVRRLLDPKHATKIGPLAEAIEALGKRLILALDEAA